MSTSSSINFSKNTARKSFKNHQTIKRNCFCPYYITVILATTIIYLFLSHQSSSIQKNKTQSQENNLPIQLNSTQIYLQNYCSRSYCQPQHIDALTSILNLIQFQNPINLSQTSNSQQQPQYVIQSVSPSPFVNIQKEQLLQINSNSLIKQSDSLFYQSNTQSILIKIPLFVIKHHKVTTPIHLSLADKISSIFTNIDQYQNIDHIVSQQNEEIQWNPKTQLISISVRSNNLIHPKSIEIQTSQKKEVHLQLIGLNINININKNVVLVPLGSFVISQGVNYINCLQLQCNQGYEAIVFKLGNTGIKKIKIYELIQ